MNIDIQLDRDLDAYHAQQDAAEAEQLRDEESALLMINDKSDKHYFASSENDGEALCEIMGWEDELQDGIAGFLETKSHTEIGRLVEEHIKKYWFGQAMAQLEKSVR